MLLKAGLLSATVATLLALAGVGYWVRRHRSGPAVDLFSALLLVTAVWTALVGVRPFVPWDLRVLLFEIDHLVSWAVPPLWLVFVLQYAGREDLLTRRRVALGGAVYVVLAGLATTNRLHHLVFADYDRAGGPIAAVDPQQTALYYLAFGLIYVCLLVGLTVLVKLLLTARHGSRTQLGLVVLAALAPIALDLSERSGLLPAGFEYTALGSGLFAVGMGVALFRGDLFAVDPVARDAVLETAEEGFVVVDRQGRIADQNDAARRLFPRLDGAFGDHITTTLPELVANSGDGPDGERDEDDADRSDGGRSVDDWSGPGVETAIPGLDEPEWFDAGRVLDEVTVFDDGERRTLRVSVTPVERGGVRQGYVLVLRDLTEVEAYAERLEQQTRQLDRFASTVSHDLRNPLSVARASAARLEAAGGDEEAVAELQSSLTRMDDLIEDALTLAREGQAIEERELVSLAAVTHDAMRMIPDTDGVRLTTELAGETVYADRDRLQRALENLLRNSVEHGSTGSQPPAGDPGDEGADATVVRVGTTEDGFYVADDGPGIPEEDRERVFEQGYTTSEDGTGLGLPIVATVVEAHGWSVDVETSQDGGACFVVSGVSFGPEAGGDGSTGATVE